MILSSQAVACPLPKQMTDKNNLRGIQLMIASMGAFSVADILVKVSTSTLSPAQVTFFLIAGGLIMFSLMAKVQGDRLTDPRAFSPILLLRYVAEIAGMVGMVTALATVPISSVGAITQASPMLAALGAVLFLNESVGWRRWISIIVGFLGVLLIVQPGAIEFDVNILWAILALVSLSVRDLTTRLVPKDMPSSSLATYTMAAALPFTIAWVVLFNGETLYPSGLNWFVMLPMIILGALGYFLLIASLRIAEVAVVMPFRYSRIIFLLVAGVMLFGERPNSWTLLGAALVIASGTYMMWREHIVQQQSQRTNH